MSKSNVCFIKLVSGEELIGDVRFISSIDHGDPIIGDPMVIKNPVALMMHPEKGLIMVPWIPYSKPAHQILNAYNEKYGSGLVIPTSEETMAVNSGPVLL